MADEQQEQQCETVTTTTTTGRNLHKLLSVGELIFEIDLRSDDPLLLLLLLLLFHVVVVLQLSLCMCNYRGITTKQQHYTVTTIIKRLMITKILNSLCRVICILLLFLLCNWSFVEKTSVKQSIKQQVCSNFQMTCSDLMYPPPPIDHRSMQHHYTK